MGKRLDALLTRAGVVAKRLPLPRREPTDSDISLALQERTPPVIRSLFESLGIDLGRVIRKDPRSIVPEAITTYGFLQDPPYDPFTLQLVATRHWVVRTCIDKLVREAVRNAWEGPVGDILRTHQGALPEDWAKTALEAILEDANARIFAFLKQPIFVGSLAPSTHPPGSTAVLCVLDGDKLSVANVGDSRLYLLRAGALEQMSVDQDLRTEILRAGRDPRAASDPSVLGALTHSVGNFLFDSQGGIGFRPIQPELFVLWIRAGDRLLLCSDGVPDCLGDGYEAVVARELSADAGAEVIAERLCRLADEALGADNITALVLLAR